MSNFTRITDFIAAYVISIWGSKRLCLKFTCDSIIWWPSNNVCTLKCSQNILNLLLLFSQPLILKELSILRFQELSFWHKLCHFCLRCSNCCIFFKMIFPVNFKEVWVLPNALIIYRVSYVMADCWTLRVEYGFTQTAIWINSLGHRCGIYPCLVLKSFIYNGRHVAPFILFEIFILYWKSYISWTLIEFLNKTWLSDSFLRL